MRRELHASATAVLRQWRRNSPWLDKGWLYAACRQRVPPRLLTTNRTGRLGKRGRERRRLLRAFVSENSAREAKGGARRDRCV